MTSPTAETSESINRRDSHRLRHGRLGALAIAFFVISAAAPLTGMAGGTPIAMLLGNGIGVPFAFAIVTSLMLIFAVGYVAMARHHTSAGAFYAYVARALGGYAGGAAAWIALLGYNTMQIGLYGLFGAATSGAIGAVIPSAAIPWWVLSYLAWASIAYLGYRQIDLSLKVLGGLVALEFLVVIIFDILVPIKGAGLGSGAEGHSLTFSSFTLDALLSGAPAIGLLFCAASFVGFEATTIYSEEAKKPSRTVPRATYIAVLTIGIFFMITSWLMVNAWGDDGSMAEFIASPELGGPTNFLFAIAEPYIGSFLATKVMVILFASSVYAALLAFHNAVARYAYALGREGLVPEALGKTHGRHLSPHMGSISQSILAGVVLTIFVVLQMDPVLTLFTWLTQLGTLAISFLMAFSAFAVFVFFRKNPTLEPNVWKSTIAPAIATIGLGLLAIFATTQFSSLIANPEDPTKYATMGWLLPALIPVAVIVGVVSAHVLKGRDPKLFSTMGRDRALQLTEPENVHHH